SRSYIEFPNIRFSTANLSSVSSNGIFYNSGFLVKTVSGERKMFFNKHNEFGDTVWTIIWDSSDAGGTGILLTDNDEFILTGGLGFGGTTADIFLSKHDSNGNNIWIQTYGGSEDEIGFGIVQDNLGNLYIGGYTNSFGKGKYDNYLLKTDPVGGKIWDKTYGTKRSEGGMVPFVFVDDFIFCWGHMDTLGALSQTGDNNYVAKLDLDGNIIWRKFVVDNNSLSTTIWNATFHPKYGIFLCGEYNVASKGLAMRFDLDGNLIWQRTYSTRRIPAWDQCYFTDIDVLDNGDIIVLGTAPSITDTTRLDRDIWVLRLDSMGCLVPGCDTLNTGIQDPAALTSTFLIYPNPARKQTKILLERPLTIDAEVLLFNFLGQKVMTVKAYQGMIDLPLDLKGLGAGIYVVQIVSNGEVLGKGKVVVDAH
ncbi:MAG: T9SS type A sorting domain-containing protein, partial [Chitinophagales bacterium]|nr:T9SS type A sorting domain-containing protein [Chitinophagales bacterium]